MWLYFRLVPPWRHLRWFTGVFGDPGEGEQRRIRPDRTLKNRDKAGLHP